MNPALQGYTAAVAEAAGPAALGGLAADLEAIEQLVLANAQLRAALTDTAVPGPARRAVVLDLLDGKVSPAARRLAAFASMAVPAPEVTAALGWVSSRVRHLDEGQDDEPGLSLLQSRQRVGGYASGRLRGHDHRRPGVARGRPVPVRPDRGRDAGPPLRPVRP